MLNFLTIIFLMLVSQTSKAEVDVSIEQRNYWNNRRIEIENGLSDDLEPTIAPQPSYSFPDPKVKKYYDEKEENPNSSDKDAIDDSAGKIVDIFQKVNGNDGNGTCGEKPINWDAENANDEKHNFDSGSGDLKLKGVDDGDKVIVNECEPGNGLSFKYSEGCVKAQKVDKQFYDFFNNHFAKCAQESAQVEGVAQISIIHDGITGDSNHTNKSMHATQRAIDLKSIAIKDSSGNEKKFTAESQDGFFTALRSCWHNAMVAEMSNCPGSQPKGSIGNEDENHHHHVHLSLPYCPQIAGKNVK